MTKELILKMMAWRLKKFVESGQGVEQYFGELATIIFAVKDNPVVAAALAARFNEMKAENVAKLAQVEDIYEAQKQAASDALNAENAAIDSALGI